MISLIHSIAGFFKNPSLRSLTISAFFILLTGTFVYHFIEGWRVLDSFYFSVITLTTVGYGDLTPQTDFGKVFTALYVLTGIGIIFGYINTLYLHRVNSAKQVRKKFKERKSSNKDQS